MATLQAGTTIDGFTVLTEGGSVQAIHLNTSNNAPAFPYGFLGVDGTGTMKWGIESDFLAPNPLVTANDVFAYTSPASTPPVSPAFFIQKFPFAIAPGGVSSVITSLSPYLSTLVGVQGTSSPTDGFFMGGAAAVPAPPTGGYVTDIQKFPFAIAPGGTVSTVGNLTEAKHNGVGSGNTTTGFYIGGRRSVSPTPVPADSFGTRIEKFPFAIAPPATASNVGDLLTGTILGGMTKNGLSTWVYASGPPPGVIVPLQKFPFAIAPGGVSTSYGSLAVNAAVNANPTGFWSETSGYLGSRGTLVAFPFSVGSPGSYSTIAALSAALSPIIPVALTFGQGSASGNGSGISIVGNATPPATTSIIKFPFNIGTSSEISVVGTLRSVLPAPTYTGSTILLQN